MYYVRGGHPELKDLLEKGDVNTENLKFLSTTTFYVVYNRWMEGKYVSSISERSLDFSQNTILTLEDFCKYHGLIEGDANIRPFSVKENRYVDTDNYVYSVDDYDYIPKSECVRVKNQFRNKEKLDLSQYVELSNKYYYSDIPWLMLRDSTVVDIDNEIIMIDDSMWSDYFNEYIHVSDYDRVDQHDEYESSRDDDNELYGYHEKKRTVDAECGKFSKFRVGFEVEKDDMPDFYFNKFEEYDTHGICLEEDGSIDGYELITPRYDMFDSTLFEKMGKYQRFLDYDENYDRENCGGHISISHETINTYDLFDKISNYIPLLYALYPKRLDGEYSRAKNKRDAKHTSSRGSIVVEKHRIEFRIFPYVKNMKQLKFRHELLTFFCKNFDKTQSQIIGSIKRGTLKKILSSVYGDDKNRYDALIERYKKYYDKYEF